jgi:hypothetical protein
MTKSQRKKALAEHQRQLAENTRRMREKVAMASEARANGGLSGKIDVDAGFVLKTVQQAKLPDGTKVPVEMYEARHRDAVRLFQKKADADEWLRQARADWRKAHGEAERTTRICRGINANYERLSNINEVYGEHLSDENKVHLNLALEHLQKILGINGGK